MAVAAANVASAHAGRSRSVVATVATHAGRLAIGMKP